MWIVLLEECEDQDYRSHTVEGHSTPQYLLIIITVFVTSPSNANYNEDHFWEINKNVLDGNSGSQSIKYSEVVPLLLLLLLLREKI